MAVVENCGRFPFPRREFIPEKKKKKSGTDHVRGVIGGWISMGYRQVFYGYSVFIIIKAFEN